jgi:uncharacterized protein (DUF362 family)
MSIIDDLLQDVQLPRMVSVRQHFPDAAIEDLAAVVAESFKDPKISGRIKAGARIALAVGSRGLDRLPLLVHCVAAAIRERGAQPFVVPAMGSHGGATAAGQVAVLAALGVTEASVGCPIVSSMETVQLGELGSGLPVLIDREAMQADGIVVINRVKPHTSFSGPIESGLVKMISIGLGKQKGADSCHAMGFGHMAVNIVEMARVSLGKAPFLFGVATIENAYDRICRLALVPAEAILSVEEGLLREARSLMPSLPFTPLDVLIIDLMGKQFSGTGTDPNVTGRASTPYLNTAQQVNKMVVLDLSPTSHGNATGVGLADICTRRLVGKIDFEATYANHITSTVLAHAKIPVTMESDRRALQLAIKTCNALDFERLRVVRIRNTLQLEHLQVSEGLLEEAKRHPRLTVTGQPREWVFDSSGNLAEPGAW